MSLRDVILSLLREPMSGTDLIRLFDGTIRHFWNTDLSQIYKALDLLERDGCVRSEMVASPRGPARKVYRLTNRGAKRMHEWIRKPAHVPPIKFEYLAQLFSVTADAEPRQRARELLRGMRDEAVRAVAVLEHIDAQARNLPGYPDALPAQVFYPWLTLQHGLLRRRALLEWIDATLARLDRRPETADAGAGPQALTDLVRMLHLLDDDEDPENLVPETKEAGEDHA